MGAIAELKAILGLDTSQYRTGMTEAERVNHKFAQSLQATERRIHNVSQVGRGLGQVLSGNIAMGVNSIVNGLDLVTGKAAMAVAKIGAVFAAFGAGAMVGSGLDKLTEKLTGKALSTRIAEVFVKPEGKTGPEWDQWRKMREGRRERFAVADIDKDTEKIRASMLEGREKAEQEHAEAVREIREKSAQEQSEVVRAAYQRQIDALDAVLAKEIKAIEDAERKKQEAKEQNYRKATEKEGERFAAATAAVTEREYRISGSDIRRDQMAAVGGMIGVSRSDVGIADKQLQKLIEDAERQKELVRLNKEHIERLAEIKETLNGGAI